MTKLPFVWFDPATSVAAFETMQKWGAANTRISYHDHNATLVLDRIPTADAPASATPGDDCVVLNNAHRCPVDCP